MSGDRIIRITVAVMVAIGAANLILGNWATGYYVLIIAFIMFTNLMTRRHLYASGYFRGVADALRAVVTSDMSQISTNPREDDHVP